MTKNHKYSPKVYCWQVKQRPQPVLYSYIFTSLASSNVRQARGLWVLWGALGSRQSNCLPEKNHRFNVLNRPSWQYMLKQGKFDHRWVDVMLILILKCWYSKTRETHWLTHSQLIFQPLYHFSFKTLSSCLLESQWLAFRLSIQELTRPDPTAPETRWDRACSGKYGHRREFSYMSWFQMVCVVHNTLLIWSHKLISKQ